MEVVPVSVGRAAQAWDEQHLDLQAASAQVAGAGSAGFTAVVSGPAARFLAAWERHVRDLGTTSEARADGLRVTVADYVATDRLAFDELRSLTPYLTEER
ncbi:hypothetical protein [Nocardioides plantarum]|uniref:Excreted virulence factor EspC (Type VII ESX diderm) n=1 Tax=Nocardioides plantarum TaxID=29299 RepID=A0ABV5K9T0_9ACTN|nr:hypothetical protein [Nocardioides plantarum]